jgi:type I restriction enzyme M protein
VPHGQGQAETRASGEGRHREDAYFSEAETSPGGGGGARRFGTIRVASAVSAPRSGVVAAQFGSIMPTKGKTKGTAGEQAATLPNLATDTEVEAYDFIRRQLRDLGWSVRDPNRSGNGQVWTQNQCLAHEHMKAAFGKVRPENIVKLSEKFVWVIEAKAKLAQLSKATDEAVNFYAEKLNSTKGQFKAVLATGVAGNESAGYLMRTFVRIDGKWQTVTINKQEATGLLSPEDVSALLSSGESDIHEFSPPQWLFVSAAERINEILHSGGINKNDRAKTMSALLLSVIHEPPNLETSLPVLIGEINARSEAELKANGKPDFAPFVKILAPTSTTNHVKFKTALVRTILELQNLNIRSAMTQAPTCWVSSMRCF